MFGGIIPIFVVKKNMKVQIYMHMKIKIKLRVILNLILDRLGGARKGDGGVDVRVTYRS